MNINRRSFLQSTSTAFAASILGAYGQDLVNRKPRRVGLIGAGWYGKSDLWRLAQVAPIDIVAISDPDKNMLAGAVEIAKQRQKSGAAPRTFGDASTVAVTIREVIFRMAASPPTAEIYFDST